MHVVCLYYNLALVSTMRFPTLSGVDHTISICQVFTDTFQYVEANNTLATTHLSLGPLKWMAAMIHLGFPNRSCFLCLHTLFFLNLSLQKYSQLPSWVLWFFRRLHLYCTHMCFWQQGGWGGGLFFFAKAAQSHYHHNLCCCTVLKKPERNKGNTTLQMPLRGLFIRSALTT